MHLKRMQSAKALGLKAFQLTGGVCLLRGNTPLYFHFGLDGILLVFENIEVSNKNLSGFRKPAERVAWFGLNLAMSEPFNLVTHVKPSKAALAL